MLGTPLTGETYTSGSVQKWFIQCYLAVSQLETGISTTFSGNVTKNVRIEIIVFKCYISTYLTFQISVNIIEYILELSNNALI